MLTIEPWLVATSFRIPVPPKGFWLKAILLSMTCLLMLRPSSSSACSWLRLHALYRRDSDMDISGCQVILFEQLPHATTTPIVINSVFCNVRWTVQCFILYLKYRNSLAFALHDISTNHDEWRISSLIHFRTTKIWQVPQNSKNHLKGGWLFSKQCTETNHILKQHIRDL